MGGVSYILSKGNLQKRFSFEKYIKGQGNRCKEWIKTLAKKWIIQIKWINGFGIKEDSEIQKWMCAKLNFVYLKLIMLILGIRY